MRLGVFMCWRAGWVGMGRGRYSGPTAIISKVNLPGKMENEDRRFIIAALYHPFSATDSQHGNELARPNACITMQFTPTTRRPIYLQRTQVTHGPLFTTTKIYICIKEEFTHYKGLNVVLSREQRDRIISFTMMMSAQCHLNSCVLFTP